MVSLKRAAECIGRPIHSTASPSVRGTVERVGEYDVWVKLSEFTIMPFDPTKVAWDDRVYQPVVDAIQTDTYYEDAQVVYENEREDVGLISSSHIANDDHRDHLLFVVLHLVQKVVVASPRANPWSAFAYEEALGWAQP